MICPANAPTARVIESCIQALNKELDATRLSLGVVE